MHINIVTFVTVIKLWLKNKIKTPVECSNQYSLMFIFFILHSIVQIIIKLKL